MFLLFADSTSRHTRGHCKKLCKPLCNSAFIAGTYWHRVINIWNALPDTVVTAPSATSFKKRLCHVDINKYNVLYFNFFDFFFWADISGFFVAPFVHFGALLCSRDFRAVFTVPNK